jgi:hypothetical protein
MVVNAVNWFAVGFMIPVFLNIGLSGFNFPGVAFVSCIISHGAILAGYISVGSGCILAANAVVAFSTAVRLRRLLQP